MTYTMSFSVECSSLVVSHLVHRAALILAVLRWLLSWALDFAGLSEPTMVRSDTSSGSSSFPSNSVVSARAVRDSLRVATYGDISGRPFRGDVAGEEDGEDGRCGGGAVADTCAVCLNELRSRDRVRVPRNCRHVFHRRCLDRWLEHDEYKTCPLCRAPLILPPPPGASDGRPLPEPSWAVERLLYLFGDDLLLATPPPPPLSSSSS